MPPESRDPASLLDILDAAQLIQRYALGIDREALRRDTMRQDAIIRRITIIGEATRRLSESFRASHPDIPWTDMAGMRSRLIHNYDQVRFDVVWDVIQHDIPALIAQIAPLVPPDEPDEAL